MILNRIFGQAEEINGDHRCETYLYRWIVFSCRWFKVYLHHFVGDDWAPDLHDHPKRFISVGLYGWYVEENDGKFKMYRAPWLRTFPATHRHRLIVPTRNTWTLVMVLKTVREWGFWHDGEFIHWKEYVYGSKAWLASKMKDC